MYRVYGDSRSGNCYKIQLLLAWLDAEFEWIEVDILKGETHTESFLARNPNGKIPVLELEDGSSLAESNAILNYLAQGSDYLPDERWHRAEVLQWQFFEQYSHEPFIAVARFIAKYLGMPAERKAEYETRQPGGHKALAVMEQQLGCNDWLAAGRPTIADISLYAYTHVAHEGGFDLGAYPAIHAWMQRLSALPRHVPMADVPGRGFG